MRGKKGEEHYNMADGSGTPSSSAVAEVTKERKRKQVLEERIGKQPQPPEIFFCDRCGLFYFVENQLAATGHGGKCPVHDKLAPKVREEAPALAGKVKKEAVARKKGKKK